MIVTLPDLEKNLMKYLNLTANEEIVITNNGRNIARLSKYQDKYEPGSKVGHIGEHAREYEMFPKPASYNEFLELTKNNNERYEYIDGTVYLLASPKTAHQKILGKLFLIFTTRLEGSKCLPMLAPYDITLKRHRDDINIVQPDLMIICDLDEKLDEKDYYTGVPALVVEIVSESSQSKDLTKKLDLYMSTGVKEYWIVNPLNHEIGIYLFDEGSIYKNVTYKIGELATSFVFDVLEVSLDMIF